MGDSRAESIQGDKGASNNWVTLIKAAAKYNPGFIWHGGDIIHDGKREKQWDNQLNVTSVVSPYFPIMYTIGNHDDGTSISGASEDNYHAVLGHWRARND